MAVSSVRCWLICICIMRSLPGYGGVFRTSHERYADDVICYCRSRAESERLMEAMRGRFACCGLMLHPEKNQVVYCKDSRRRWQFPQIQFTFLGYWFRPRMAKNRHGEI
jgi:RNA-directed DNA polymerase